MTATTPEHFVELDLTSGRPIWRAYRVGDAVAPRSARIVEAASSPHIEDLLTEFPDAQFRISRSDISRWIVGHNLWLEDADYPAEHRFPALADLDRILAWKRERERTLTASLSLTPSGPGRSSSTPFESPAGVRS